MRAVLLEKEIAYDTETMDRLISTVADTLLISKEDISTKLDAISLLICIAVKYSEDYIRNQSIYEKLFEQQESIEDREYSVFLSNIDGISLKIGLQFLYVSMGKDVYGNILELMAYIQEDVATIVAVTHLIIEYLETTDSVVLPSKIEAVVLQNVLRWLHSEHLDVRWNATRIFLMLCRNPENRGIVNHRLINLVDENNVYIKNLIVQKIYDMDEISSSTKEYIMTKCRQDTNFVVRMVCAEVEGKRKNSTE